MFTTENILYIVLLTIFIFCRENVDQQSQYRIMVVFYNCCLLKIATSGLYFIAVIVNLNHQYLLTIVVSRIGLH